ncbi:hypothetical protein AWM75_05955 [Aerococcus urinaehominis]|uniref:Regulatory protein RecX n=1 Tax=Aerococcus urinaehominis TaxID=128944 RepID=A0A0X8FLK8_9LACT|nr:RecX family transcriptional regulator [Aerococcus urinaehominis]AMB99568.1 hypothetical protein AWM75_05955 [Aerococcus urinaehominis]SDM35451.1 regulatory protein [Aerococcus urinaehominis]
MSARKKGPVRLSDLSGSAKTSNWSKTRDIHTEKNKQAQPVTGKSHEGNADDLIAKAKALKASKELEAEGQDRQTRAPQNVDCQAQQNGDQPAIQAGRITMIQVQKKNKERYNIYLNQTYAFAVSESVLVRFALHKGQELDREMVKNIKAAERESWAFQLATRYLAHRLRSEKEVRDKLASQEILAEDIDRTIDKLKEMKLVDDLVYGQSYVRTSKRLQKKGPGQISRYLKEKGLDQETINQSLQEYSQKDQVSNLEEIAKKYFDQQSRRHAIKTARQKTQAYLYSKGYASDLIRSVLADLISELDQEDQKQEDELLIKSFAKYYRRYHKLNPRERLYKVKSLLYQKGFASEAINRLADQYQEEE